MTLCTNKWINTAEVLVDIKTKGKAKDKLVGSSGPRNQRCHGCCDHTRTVAVNLGSIEP